MLENRVLDLKRDYKGWASQFGEKVAEEGYSWVTKA